MLYSIALYHSQYVRQSMAVDKNLRGVKLWKFDHIFTDSVKTTYRFSFFFREHYPVLLALQKLLFIYNIEYIQNSWFEVTCMVTENLLQFNKKPKFQ